jgi:hypothetical protein
MLFMKHVLPRLFKPMQPCGNFRGLLLLLLTANCLPLLLLATAVVDSVSNSRPLPQLLLRPSVDMLMLLPCPRGTPSNRRRTASDIPGAAQSSLSLPLLLLLLAML